MERSRPSRCQPLTGSTGTDREAFQGRSSQRCPDLQVRPRWVCSDRLGSLPGTPGHKLPLVPLSAGPAEMGRPGAPRSPWIPNPGFSPNQPQPFAPDRASQWSWALEHRLVRARPRRPGTPRPETAGSRRRSTPPRRPERSSGWTGAQSPGRDSPRTVRPPLPGRWPRRCGSPPTEPAGRFKEATLLSMAPRHR